MDKVGVKRILIYKNHIFPEMRKPLRSLSQYLMVKNPDLDRMKARKMSQILDEDEKKRLRAQKDILNVERNADLQKYYRKYVHPFQTCPDFYSMLFKYAIKKTQALYERKIQNKEQPFFISKKQIKQLVKLVKHQFKPKQDTQNQALKEKDIQKNKTAQLSLLLKGQAEDQVKSQEKQKLLFEIYRQLYPSQKVQVENRFLRFYQQFLIQQQEISRQILQNKITHMKPFLFTSPLEFYQSKNTQKTMKQCQKILIDDVIERERVNIEYVKYLQNRQKELDLLSERYQVGVQELWSNYRNQYYHPEKYHSFYSMLQNV